MSFFLTDPPAWTVKSLKKRISAMTNITSYSKWNQRQVFTKMTSNVRYKSGVKFQYGHSLMGGNLYKHKSILFKYLIF